MRYAWNRGRSVDAQLFGQIVEDVADRNGGVCPSWALVDEARPEDSPLHSMFEWDDHRAAEGYRRDQARHHLRELRVVTDTEQGERRMQALVHVVRMSGDDPVEGYRLTSKVVRSASEYQQVLDEAYAQLRAWHRRYEHLGELAEVHGVIAQTV